MQPHFPNNDVSTNIQICSRNIIPCPSKNLFSTAASLLVKASATQRAALRVKGSSVVVALTTQNRSHHCVILLSRTVRFPPSVAVRSFFFFFNWKKSEWRVFRLEDRVATVAPHPGCSRPIQVTWARRADEMTFMNDKYKRAPTPVGVRLNPSRLPAS